MKELDGYSARKVIIENVRSATSDIRIMTHVEIGNPLFDTIPEVLKSAPSQVDIRVLLIIPNDGFDDGDPALETMDDLMRLGEERLSQGGKFSGIKVIRESELPPSLTPTPPYPNNN